jgi:hypothetical protein
LLFCNKIFLIKNLFKSHLLGVSFITAMKNKWMHYSCSPISSILIKQCRLIDWCSWQRAAAVRVWLKCDVGRIRENWSNEITIQLNDKQYEGLKERQDSQCNVRKT